jgi:DNA-binding MarR family transcriptional regulator
MPRMSDPVAVRQSATVTDGDHVDHLLAQWHVEMPDLDPSPMAVIARVSRLGRIFDRRVEELYAEFGLNQSQFGVLAALRRAGPPYCLSPTELYNSLLISSGAMTNRLERLESAGYIDRVPDPEDGRSMLVALTPSGKKLIERVLQPHYQNGRRLLSALSDEERGQLAGLLRRLLLEFEDHVPPASTRPLGGARGGADGRRAGARSRAALRRPGASA